MPVLCQWILIHSKTTKIWQFSLAPMYIFLYGPSGLPLTLPSQEQPNIAIFRDTSYFIDWKKYHLRMVPNLDLNLDRGISSSLCTGVKKTGEYERNAKKHEKQVYIKTRPSDLLVRLEVVGGVLATFESPLGVRPTGVKR